MATRRLAPSVNAGSMADIAFLLLIFFLVSTTIETDQGISKKLPPIVNDTPVITIHDRNIFNVRINQLNELLVEGETMNIMNLKDAAIAFLDNGGGKGAESCMYCKGDKKPTLSDNPNKAVISLHNSSETSYEMYIRVQNELIKAYAELRDREAKKLFGRSFTAMEVHLRDINFEGDKSKLRAQIKEVRAMYPEKISEAEREY